MRVQSRQDTTSKEAAMKKVTKSVSTTSSTQQQQRRNQKTLGWFLSEELLEKTSSSPSPPAQTRVSAPSVIGSGAATAAEEKKRRRGGRGHRQRKLTETLSTASEASLPQMIDGEDDKKADTTLLPTAPASDFYVYDVASDGYYYEQNGAKGWRRRLPQGVQPKKPAAAAAAASEDPLHQQAALVALQRNHISALQSAIQQQQTSTAYNRYYDAPTDGYFFEMASVDGWRKRTAVPSVGSPAAFGTRLIGGGAATARLSAAPALFLPVAAAAQLQLLRQHQSANAAAAAAPSQSYGAALARGELPAKCVIDSSASSSVSDDLSYPSLSRPTSLDLVFGEKKDEEATLQWNADKFIEELVGQFDACTELDAGVAALDGEPKTPATSMWSRRFAAAAASPVAAAANDEEQEEYALTKELENIWKTPTPVHN